MKNKGEFTLISIFSGAMGLDLGLERAGFVTKIAIDIDKSACATIRRNRPNLPIIEGDINKIAADEILEEAGLKRGEVTLLAGGSPCQSFSTAGRRRAFDDIRGKVLLRFIELVEEIQPKYFLLENVRGILSAKIKSRPSNEIGEGFPPLQEDEKKGSVLRYILERLEKTGYKINFDLLNSADYGVPQNRERVVFIGCRSNTPVILPKPTHSKNPKSGQKPWKTFGDLIEELGTVEHTYKPYGSDRMKYMRLIPRGGGNWRDLPKEVVIEAMGKAYYSGGGKVGFFRRISLDKPSPTLLTSPTHKSTNLGHPLEDRPLSIEEYRAIQEFPPDWIIHGSIADQYKQIGNAVPVGLAYCLGCSIVEHINKNK